MGQCAHLKNYAILPGCEVVALAEIRPQWREKVAARYGIPRTYATHRELLANEKLDGIVAAQHFRIYGQLVPELLQAGVPVFIEKPLASSVPVAQKIVEAVAASGTWVMVGYHKRSDPATRYAKAEIDRLKQTGELGKLRLVRMVMPPGDWIAGGFNDLIGTDEPYPELASDPVPPDMDDATFREYGAFVNYYIHQVNLLRHLLGEPYRVTYADPSGVLLSVLSASGVAGTLEMAAYSTTVDWHESALACFERGYVKLELPAPLASNRPGRVEILRDPGEDTTPMTCVPSLPWVHAERQQAENFLAALRGEAEPPCQAPEALEDLLVAREYMRQLQEGRTCH
jgi:predicted dehydrogenase